MEILCWSVNIYDDIFSHKFAETKKKLTTFYVYPTDIYQFDKIPIVNLETTTTTTTKIAILYAGT